MTEARSEPTPVVPPSGSRLWPVALAAALVALVSTIATLDDPGLTIDEPIYAGQAKRLVLALEADPTCVTRADAAHALWRSAHEHPPLGRLILGASQRLLGDDQGAAAPPTGRLGRPASAVAYAAIAFLATIAAGRIGGLVAGWVAAVGVLLMPRLFAHAHFASLEVVAAFFSLAALLAAGAALDRSGRRRYLVAALAGAVLGLAFLTKLTAVLVPLAVLAALALRRRGDWLGPIAVWLLVGAAIFFLGWPWLWPFDFPGYSPGWRGSAERTLEYLASGVERATVYVWYFGRQYPNAESRVPWHFAWTFFAVSVPIGLQFLGVVGGWRSWRCSDRGAAAAILPVYVVVTLLVFTLPVERYDGERLFLSIFPPWAVLVGVGGAAADERLVRTFGRLGGRAILAAFLAAQAVGVVRYHPFQLSYYNLLVGGLKGADRLGLEATYWGDSVDQRLLDELARVADPGDRAILAPTLYAGHAAALASDELRRKEIVVLPADELRRTPCRWAVLFNRGGYVHDPLPTKIQQDGTLVAETTRDGVWLARIYRLPDGFRLP